MNANQESAGVLFLKWWPVVVFLLVQTATAGVMYGDLRARLAEVARVQEQQAKKQDDMPTQREISLTVENAILKSRTR